MTGAGGFVGSHVVDALARMGVDLVALSRRPLPPERLPGGAANILLDHGQATPADYERIGLPDLLIHLAWEGLPHYRSPHHVERELPAQLSFVRAMVEAGLPAMLISGTCYEYGMIEGELSEEMGAPPANEYARAKLALYEAVARLRDARPFALTWARLFYLWGPRQAAGSLYPQLRAAAARGDALFPMSKGDQQRDYLPVEEAARLLVALGLRGAGAGIVNVCSGRPVTVLSLVERWIRENGWRIAPDPGHFPVPDYEPFAFWGSTAKLRRLLGEA